MATPPLPVTPASSPATTSTTAAAHGTTVTATTDPDPIDQNEVIGVGGAKASEYVKAAAFLGGAIAYLPLASSWLGAVGYTYYNRLLREAGWDANILDLPDRAFAFKGYEIVVNATNLLVPAFLFVIPAALLAGLIVGITSSTFDYVRKAKGKPPLLKEGTARIVRVIGRLSYAIATAVIFLYSIVVVVYLTPSIARNVADELILCVKRTGEQDKCSPAVDYGVKAQAGHLLVADKAHIYVYEGGSYKRLAIDDASVTYIGKRPDVPSPTPKPTPTPASRGHQQ